MAEHGKTQSEHFKDTAREHSADEPEGSLDRIFGKLNLHKKPVRQDDGERGDGGTDSDNKDG